MKNCYIIHIVYEVAVHSKHVRYCLLNKRVQFLLMVGTCSMDMSQLLAGLHIMQRQLYFFQVACCIFFCLFILYFTNPV